MADELKGKTIAIIATDGVEQVELIEPRKAVENAGATAVLLSPDTGEIQAMNSDINPADTFTVDKAVSDVSPDQYDGLILPGGTVTSAALDLARAIVRSGERRTVKLAHEGKVNNPAILVYLNRASSLLFVLARYEEKQHRVRTQVAKAEASPRRRRSGATERPG